MEYIYISSYKLMRAQHIDAFTRPQCGADEGGCSKGEAWIGVHFDEPKFVKCIQLLGKDGSPSASLGKGPGLKGTSWEGTSALHVGRSTGSLHGGRSTWAAPLGSLHEGRSTGGGRRSFFDTDVRAQY